MDVVTAVLSDVQVVDATLHTLLRLGPRLAAEVLTRIRGEGVSKLAQATPERCNRVTVQDGTVCSQEGAPGARRD